MKTCGWICVIAGIWLFLAPFTLGYSAHVAALWNDMIIGVVIVIAGAYMCSSKKKAQ